MSGQWENQHVGGRGKYSMGPKSDFSIKIPGDYFLKFVLRKVKTYHYQVRPKQKSHSFSCHSHKY